MKSWTYLSRAATDISCAVSPTKAIQVGQMLNWELANKISPWKSCSCQLVKDYQRWRHDQNFTQNIIFQTQRRFSLSCEYGLNDGAKLKLCLFAHRQPSKGKRWVWIGFGKGRKIVWKIYQSTLSLWIHLVIILSWWYFTSQLQDYLLTFWTLIFFILHLTTKFKSMKTFWR